MVAMICNKKTHCFFTCIVYKMQIKYIRFDYMGAATILIPPASLAPANLIKTELHPVNPVNHRAKFLLEGRTVAIHTTTLFPLFICKCIGGTCFTGAPALEISKDAFVLAISSCSSEGF